MLKTILCWNPNDGRLMIRVGVTGYDVTEGPLLRSASTALGVLLTHQ